MNNDGKVTAVIIATGGIGLFGIGEHNVAVPFATVKRAQKNSRRYLAVAASKDTVKAAPGLKYDSAKMTWVWETPEHKG